MAVMNGIWDKVKSFFTQKNRLNPNDAGTQEGLINSMNAGKTITLNNPESDRFSFVKGIASGSDSKQLKNFTPKTKEEKETLSPSGYFRQGELEKVREKMKERLLSRREEELKAQGKRMTKDRREEIEASVDRQAPVEAQVPSTALKSVKYNPKTQELFVKFQGNSKTYWYPRVPQIEVQRLMEAPSKGEYFLQNIHDQYTVNPGHKSSKNKERNSNRYTNYRKMKKYYKNVMRTGRM